MVVHILSIYSPFDGHLSCFQGLAFMNSAAVTTNVYVCVLLVLLGVELLGHMVVLCLTF